MADTTTTIPRTPRRPHRRRRPIVRHPRRAPERRLDRTTAAALALHELIDAGDFIDRGRRQFLVAPVSRELMEVISIGLAATEDDEPNGDLEPSVGEQDDLEGDGLTDKFAGECALVSEPEDQRAMQRTHDEDEPDLGWSGYGTGASVRERKGSWTLDEGDGNVDDEDGDPSGDPLDRGELDHCDDEPDCSVSWSPAGSVLTFPGRRMPS